MKTETLESKLKEIIQHHLTVGKEYDPYRVFSEARDKKCSNKEEFAELLKKDPAFQFFGVEHENYITARMGGNLITSFHRKVGDIYENCITEILKSQIPGIHENDAHYSVKISINGRMQERSTDGAIFIEKLPPAAQTRIRTIIESLKDGNARFSDTNFEGIAFEVRSCYQIGDSKRIQADETMGEKLYSIGLLPVMLVMCNTSLKQPVTRLKRTWVIKEGGAAFELIKEITEFDLYGFLQANRDNIEADAVKIFDTV